MEFITGRQWIAEPEPGGSTAIPGRRHPARASQLRARSPLVLYPDRPAAPQASTLRQRSCRTPEARGDIRDLARLLERTEPMVGHRASRAPAVLQRGHRREGRARSYSAAARPERSSTAIAAPVPLGRSPPASGWPLPPTSEVMPAAEPTAGRSAGQEPAMNGTRAPAGAAAHAVRHGARHDRAQAGAALTPCPPRPPRAIHDRSRTTDPEGTISRPEQRPGFSWKGRQLWQIPPSPNGYRISSSPLGTHHLRQGPGRSPRLGTASNAR